MKRKRLLILWLVLNWMRLLLKHRVESGSKLLSGSSFVSDQELLKFVLFR